MRILQVTPCDNCKGIGKANPGYWIRIETIKSFGDLLTPDDPGGDFCSIDCAAYYLAKLKAREEHSIATL